MDVPVRCPHCDRYCDGTCPMARLGVLYLLHWSPPLVGGQSPRHYLGWTNRPVQERIAEHLNDGPHAARIVVAAVAAGREIVVAKTWPGTRDDEARLKRAKRGFVHLCPVCQKEAVMPAAKLDYDGIIGYLGTMEARGQYNGTAVVNRLVQLGVPEDKISHFRECEPSGMSISTTVAKVIAPEHYDGGYGGWGFQHSANIRAIGAKKAEGPQSMKDLMSF